jgi:hypothetical protein
MLAFGGRGKEAPGLPPRALTLRTLKRALTFTRLACSHRFSPVLMALKNAKDCEGGRQVQR